MTRKFLFSVAIAVVLVLSWWEVAYFAQDPLGQARLVGEIRWSAPGHPEVGGFSGLEISDDGNRITALTDRAYVIDATLRRRDSEIAGVEIGAERRLISDMGTWMDQLNSDTESLAGTVGATVFLSSEGRPAIYSLSTGSYEVLWLETGTTFSEIHGNTGIEAMAIDQAGRLFVIPEALRRGAGTIPVFVYEDGIWSERYQMYGVDGYEAAGADFGPDGRLYLLERKFSRWFGFSSQIRAFDFSAPTPISGEIILRSRFLQFANLEGLAAWSLDGKIRLTTISDNNFLWLLPTWIVEFEL